jgi:hypothetical protein
MVLGVTSYQPRQLYDELVIITNRANGEEAMLVHLVNWFCIACTLTQYDANNDPAPPPVTLLTNGLMRPGLDEKLAAHILVLGGNKIYADVRAVNPQTGCGHQQ